jgi:hypothetical protein
MKITLANQNSENTTNYSSVVSNEQYHPPELTRVRSSMKDFKNLKKIVNLEDHYKVFDKIGEGGFAQVFKA